MDIKLNRELLKLHSINFQRAPDLRDSFENLLIESKLSVAEIGLCSSKLFQSEQGFFHFLDKHVSSKDPLLADTRKMLYKLVAEYIKYYKDYVVEYLESIYENCIRSFKREDSNKSKEASLHPIITIMKKYDAKILKEIINPYRLSCILLDEIQFCKPMPTVKGTIFQCLGLISGRIEDSTERNVKVEMFNVAYGTLKDQIKASKPDLTVVQGVIKFFRFTIQQATPEQRSDLFTHLKIFMIPIKDVASQKIPNAAIKCLKDNLQFFELEVMKNADDLFKQLMKILVSSNKNLKENASDLLEQYTQFLSDKLNSELNKHRILFNNILDRFCEILGDSKQQDLFTLTVVIRSVGQFARAIVKLRGEQQLAQFFDHLNELGQIKVLDQYQANNNEDNNNNNNNNTMKRGIHFKIILYRQKQLNSFLSAYGNIIKNLKSLSDKQIHHLFDICILCIKQHYNYFENYKQYLYSSFANLIIAIQQHNNVAIQFMDRLFSQGTEDALKVYDQPLYIHTCEELANLWIGIIKQPVWSQHSLKRFTDCIFKQANSLIVNTNFESTLKKEDKDYRYMANNAKQLTQFHRFSLMFSKLLGIIPYDQNQISQLLKNVFQRIKKYPKAVLLLIFSRIIVLQIKDANLVKEQIILTSQLIKLIHHIINNLKMYTYQLQSEALTLLLCMPKELITNNNYSLLKSEYLEILKSSFNLNLLLPAWYGVNLLVSMLEQDRKNQYKFKQLLKLLGNTIPQLSNYMQIVPEQEEQLQQEIIYIDTVFPIKKLLNEQIITRSKLIERVTYFLGSIGGLSHMIVDDKLNQSLLAWDYTSPITLPLLRADLRIGQLLERILILCIDAPTDKIKVLSSELLHAFVIYMIGKSANESIKGFSKNTQQANKRKTEYANIYKRVFPIIIKIANSLYHPSKEYFAELLLQITHWFANSRQYEAPDVAQLLDCLFEEPIKNNQLTQYCSNLIGEFIHWTLKQMSKEELIQNYSNIKTVIRRILTYANHPDSRYKQMALNCIYQLVNQTKQESFIVEKYFIELASQLKFIAKELSSQITNQIVDIISNAFHTFDVNQPAKRSGRFTTLNEFLDYLLDEAINNKDGVWQQLALTLWFKSVDDVRKRLMKQCYQNTLFPKKPIQRLIFQENTLLIDAEQLAYQCRIWQSLQQYLTRNETDQLEDFQVTLQNIQKFLNFFLNLKQQTKSRISQQEQESPLFDILFTITQENFNPSQNNDRFLNMYTTNVPEQYVEQFIQTLQRVFSFLSHFSIELEDYEQLACVLLLKPSYYLVGIQLDQCQEFQTAIHLQTTEEMVRITLNELFEGKKLDQQLLSFKDIVELKYYLNGLQIISKQPQFQVFFQELIQTIGNLLQKSQELHLDVIQLFLDFLLQSDYADDFVIQSLQMPTEFRQRNEQALLTYVVRRFPEIQYFEKAKDDVTLLRYSLNIIQQLHTQNKSLDTIQFKTSRLNNQLLLLEIQIKYFLLTYLQNFEINEYEDLIKYALKQQHSIEIHSEALLLFGLYSKRVEYLQLDYLNEIRNKYFPIKVLDLPKDSLQYQNFKIILEKLVFMIKLSDKIQLIEILFPILRQDIQFDIGEFNPQLHHLQWLMTQILDEELDKNPIENARTALGVKVLLPLLKKCDKQILLNFYIQYLKTLLQPAKCDDNWQSITLFLKMQTLYLELFGVAYSCLGGDMIKNDLHQKIYQNSQGNELTKKLVGDCRKITRMKYEKIYIYEAHSKEINFDFRKLVSDYHCAAYITLIEVIKATQTKENVFAQFLFQNKAGETLWENVLPNNWQFNFQVETDFVEKPIIEEVKKKNLSDQVIQLYLNTATIGNYGMEIEQQPIVIEQEQQQQQQEQQQQQPYKTIELDDVNKHQLMLPLLEVIDYLNEKFPGQQQEMPSWMTCIFQELSQMDKPLHIRIFLIKLIVNRVKIFERYGQSFLDPLLAYCSKENKPNGGKGFHYFLRDVVVIVIQLSIDQGIREDYLKTYPQSKQRLCSVANNLISLTANPVKKLFQQNVEILALFIQNFKEHIYLCDKIIVSMIQSEKQADSELWQANGLAVLEIALLNNVRILSDYQEFIRTQTGAIYERYRFILQRNTPQLSLPNEYIYKIAVNYATKKHILKGIAAMYGALLQCCIPFRDMQQEYEAEILRIGLGILHDTRPGYGKKKFTDFLRVVSQVYPKILNNGKLFMTASDLITQATSTERGDILMIFESFLKKIENYTDDAQYFINQIVISIEGSIMKIMVDQDILVHYSLLQLLKQLVSLKCINLSTQQTLKCFRAILPRIDGLYGSHYELGIVQLYLEILQFLHEFLNNYEDPLMGIVTNNLLQLFVSQHTEIRKICFEYFQKDMEMKATKQQYEQNQQQTQMDRIITLMKEIYQPKREDLFLRGAVPLLLSQGKKSSDYDQTFFDRNLDEDAHYYDQEFRNKKYFKQANLTQQFSSSQYGTQYGSQYASSTYLSQVLNPQGIRATQQQQQQESYQLSQIDEDGFKVPYKYRKQKNKDSNISQFLTSNEISTSQIQINADNKLRYVPESQNSFKDKSKNIFNQRANKNINQFQQNQVRKYRFGELPDILIKRKDILDPLIELCFEDEEMAGRLFTTLFEQMYDKDRQVQIQATLTNLLERSTAKNFMFISTIMRTMYQVIKKSDNLFPHNQIIKKIGLESLAYYQSMILIEESLMIAENEGQDTNSLWMDLIDLHQHQGNQAQIQGILDIILKRDKHPLESKINSAINMKEIHDYNGAKNTLKQLIEEYENELQKVEGDWIDARMQKFLQEEYDDTLRKLGMWDELDSSVVQRVSQFSDLEMQQNSGDVRKALHKLLRVSDDGQADIVKAHEIYRKIGNYQDNYLIEITQMFQGDQDTDQARYYLSKSTEQFLQKWTQLLNQNALLSKPLRHQHLEQLQIIHEIGEFQINQEKCFDSWNMRSPSIQYDSLVTWKRVFENRRLMVGQHSCVGQWAIQTAKGLVKMHLYDQASALLAYSYAIRQNKKQEFDWNFYQTIAQVKLKQISAKMDLIQNRVELLLKCNDPKDCGDELETHNSYANLFTKEYIKYKDQIKEEEIKVKFKLLPLQCNENYLNVNYDLVFLIEKHELTVGSTYFYQRYATVLSDTLQEYEESAKFILDLPIKQKFYKQAAQFFERCLRLIEVRGSDQLRNFLYNKNISCDRIADLFVRYAINYFKLQDFNSNKNLLIKVLKVVQNFPNQIGPTFQNAMENNYLQSAMFLEYLPLMIHIISNERQMPYFKKIFKDFMEKFPQQFIYQFNVTFEDESDCKNQYALRIYQDLRKRVPRNFEFIAALNQLTHPQHRLFNYLQQCKEHLDNPEELLKIRTIIQNDIFARNQKFQGPLNLNFAKTYEKYYQKLQFKDIDQFKEIIDLLKIDIDKIQAGNFSINDMSPWLMSEEAQDVLIPAKLSHFNNSVRIASVDQKMLTLQSGRKPKKIIIYGSDEKTYQFLVKGIEDLRLDQRIEQLFEVMNTFDDECQLSTYAVIPMGKRIGLLEWVDQTKVLKQVLQDEFQDFSKTGANKSRGAHLDKLAVKYGICTWDKLNMISLQQKHLPLLQSNEKDIVDHFEEQKKFIPEHLLRSGLLNMSQTVEAFVFIRDNFLKKYANVCASGYILGIGDRHLENFLLNYETGDVVLIDFGFSLGSSVDLYIPELMPFRLTQIFEGLGKPIGLGGIFRHELVKVMENLRRKRQILLDFCEVFMNDPLLDQMKIAKEKNKAANYLSQAEMLLKQEEQIYEKSSVGDSSVEESMKRNKEYIWYPMKKIDIVRKKLIGMHCSLILMEEIEESRHQKGPYIKQLKETIMGNKKNRKRYQYINKTILSVVEQVDCLIDMATDPNILGRTWIGWTPYI